MVNLVIPNKGICLYDKNMKLFIHEFSLNDSITKVETSLGVRFSFVSRDKNLTEMLITPKDKVYALIYKMYVEIGDTYPVDNKIKYLPKSETNVTYSAEMGFDWESKVKIEKSEEGLVIKYCGEKQTKYKQVIVDPKEIKNGNLLMKFIEQMRDIEIDETYKISKQKKEIRDNLKKLNIKERGRMVGVEKLIENKGICLYNEKTMVDIYAKMTHSNYSDDEDRKVAAIIFDFNGKNKNNMVITVNVEDEIFPILEKMYFDLEYINIPKYSNRYGENKEHVVVIKDDDNKSKKQEDSSYVKITGNRENITLEYVGPTELVNTRVVISDINSVNGERKKLAILQAINKIEMLTNNEEKIINENPKTLKMER